MTGLAPAAAPGPRQASARRTGVPGWWALSILLALGAVLVKPNDVGQHAVLEWQPSLALTQPWRWWSAAWVHYSDMHLRGNLVGVLLVAGLGWAGSVRRHAAIAWGLAWPMTHLALLLQPSLEHYGGLSGVLHAGVAVAAVLLVFEPSRLKRGVGAALLAGLTLKLLAETPWAGPLRHAPGWDIAIAPFAHLAGVIAGAACAVLLHAVSIGARSMAP